METATVKRYHRDELMRLAGTRSLEVRFQLQEKVPDLVAEEKVENSHADRFRIARSWNKQTCLNYLCKHVEAKFDPMKCPDQFLRTLWIRLSQNSSQKEKDEYLKTINGAFNKRVTASM
jgi:hypothetical protein